MATTEKPLDEQQHTPDNVSIKDEAHDSSMYDAVSSEKTPDEAEKKNGGSMRDYFVRADRDSPETITTSANTITAYLPLCRSTRPFPIRRCHHGRNRIWCCFTSDDVGLWFVDKLVD